MERCLLRRTFLVSLWKHVLKIMWLAACSSSTSCQLRPDWGTVRCGSKFALRCGSRVWTASQRNPKKLNRTAVQLVYGGTRIIFVCNNISSIRTRHRMEAQGWDSASVMLISMWYMKRTQKVMYMFFVHLKHVWMLHLILQRTACDSLFVSTLYRTSCQTFCQLRQPQRQPHRPCQPCVNLRVNLSTSHQHLSSTSASISYQPRINLVSCGFWIAFSSFLMCALKCLHEH